MSLEEKSPKIKLATLDNLLEAIDCLEKDEGLVTETSKELNDFLKVYSRTCVFLVSKLCNYTPQGLSMGSPPIPHIRSFNKAFLDTYIKTLNKFWELLEKSKPGILKGNRNKAVDECFLESSKNNGGDTNYYDLPKPSKQRLKKFFAEHCNPYIGSIPEPELGEILDKLLELFPETLNDLIEHKKMPFWQGEIAKASYGLDGRIYKFSDKDPLSVEVRELNKIIYYANRRLKAIKKEREA